jgi:hypothetical protein
VRFNWSAYGLDQSVGAIKLRVQEQGGAIAPATAESQARIVKQEALHLAQRERLFWDQQWITGTVQPAVARLLNNAAEKSNTIANEHDLPFTATRKNLRCVIEDGRISVAASWRQQYSNKLEDARLLVTEFNGVWAEPGFQFVNPEELNQQQFRAELSRAGELCWVDNAQPSRLYSHEELADQIVQVFLALHARQQRGEHPSARDRMLRDLE